jgi:IS30 family transposase
MAKMCRRLSAVERVRIELGLRDGLSLTRIAEAIGRPKGTVSKEITRHGGAGAYAADAAHIQSVGVPRGGRPNRLKPGKPVFEAVAALLRQRPEQISGRRKRMEDDGEASSGLAVRRSIRRSTPCPAAS